VSAKAIPAASPFEVIGIVTSAGGLEALSAVLADLPVDNCPPVMVGQHLPEHSELADILRRRSPMHVAWARDGMPLQPGSIHVMPPRSQLEVLPDHTCSVRAFDGDVHADRPLDALLQSLADSYGGKALAIVLTGLGRDGAIGARAVKDAGGAVLVQSEETAQYPEMPRAAVQAGAADLVLPLAILGTTLADVVAGGRFPQPRNEFEAREALFAGPGEARAALREVDWSQSLIGPVIAWPVALKGMVASILHTGFAASVSWGDEFVQVYNDAWISLLGDLHPSAAGAPARFSWADKWGPLAQACREVLQSGRTRTMHDEPLEVHRHGRPEAAWFTLSISPLADDRGELRGLLTIANETTNRVMAERRLGLLRALAASSGAGTAVQACDQAAAVFAEDPHDLPFVLAYFVDAAGVRASLAAASGLPAGSHAAPRTVELLSAAACWPVGRVVRQGTPLLLNDLAVRMRHAQGDPASEALRSALLVPLRGMGGAIAGVLVAGLSPRVPFDQTYRDFVEMAAQQLATNVFEARQRERERVRLEQLAELDRVKTEFFSNVSHEFRTPLTLILAPLEDVLETKDSLAAPLRQELQAAARNARRLLTLVDALLDFSQIEAGRRHARCQLSDLSALTRDISSLFRSAIEHAGLALEVDCPPLSEPVPVDRQMWEQVVSNLLSNALKFTFAGRIRVDLRELPQHVELEVADTGVGIPEDELQQVFRRFHRVRGARARTSEGAGIGLAMVDELVRLHHGRVRARSTLGQGTTFTVWLNKRLPAEVVQPSAADVGKQRQTAHRMADEAARWSAAAGTLELPADVAESIVGAARRGLAAGVPGAAVLVVDDNADMRDYLARVLGACWNVRAAGDGEEALRLARESPPDLILADVMMPALDGFGLLRRVRSDARLRATPVILVTARAQEETAIAGLLAGADDYLAKPFSSRELVARVGAQLQLARARREGEHELRELLALMPVGVYACDARGRFNYTNRRAVELWGGEPPAGDRSWALRGGPAAMLQDGTLLDEHNSPLAHALRTGQPVSDRKLVIQRLDGSKLDVLLNVRLERDADGQVVGAVAAFLDMSARKAAERALQTFQDEREQQDVERTAALPASE
jgi:PAS domain S-box-containing protein